MCQGSWKERGPVMGAHIRYNEKKETRRRDQRTCNERGLWTIVGYESTRPAR
jgi:hypothetical protein